MDTRFAENLERIRNNLDQLNQKIAAASERCLFEKKLPLLVAVTKYAELDWVEALYQLGHRDFGENRPQQLSARYEKFSQEQPLDTPDWHLIGQLQRNKVRVVLGKAVCIHSVHSLALLQRLRGVCDEMQCAVNVLLQVNVSGEQSKQGFTPDELLSLAPELNSERGKLSIIGLMTMAPRTEKLEETRAVFRKLRQFRDQLQLKVPEETRLSELSMGMSNDFEIAIEEGATMVRIGSKLFETCVKAEPQT